MNLFKKVVASIALVALVSGVFSTGVGAYSTAQLEAANDLAAKGIINTKADAAGYNLDQNVLRQEIAAVARGVAGLEKSTTVKGTFSDVTATSPNNWAVYSIEPLAEAGIITTANSTFRPEDKISKAEALGMMVEAATKGEYSFDASKGTSWQEQVVDYAVNNGISARFSDYDTAATRGWVFEAGSSAMSAGDTEDTLLGDLLGGLINDDEEEEEEETDNTDTDSVVSDSNGLVVSLSPDTPEGTTVPGLASGIPVASFDLTAGNSDVIIDGFVVKRKGLSSGDTLTALAVFSDEGRVSKSRDDTQENEDQANLNFNDPQGIKAGETQTYTLVVDVASAEGTNGVGNHDFSIELLSIETSSSVTFDGKMIGETFRVAGVDAPEVTIVRDGNVSNPTLGEEDAEVFKFEVQGASDEDVVLKAITLRSSENDVSDNLRNFKLTQNNKIVAETEKTNEEYLTFNLGDGLLIKEDEDLNFIITADIVEGAGDEFAFFIDRELDVRVQSTKFNSIAAANIVAIDTEAESQELTIEAGELTIKRVDVDIEDIKEDKDNIILGQFEVTNQSGGDLDLEEFGVLVSLTSDTASGANAFTAGADSATTVNVSSIFDDFELVNVSSGRSDTLEIQGTASSVTSTGVYGDDSLGIKIGKGTTMFAIKVDTANTINDFETVQIELSFNTGRTDRTKGFFVVEEQDDDEEVTDISPSFISFNTVDGVDSAARLSLNPLPITTNVVRGADGVPVLSFDIEADRASTLRIDEIIVEGHYFGSGVTVITTGGTDITNQQISNISLYNTTGGIKTLLESNGGNDIEANGQMTFNDFDDIFVKPNQTATFLVEVDVLDSDGVENITLTNFNVAAIDIDDEDNDNVVVALPTTPSNNETLVLGSGVLSGSFDVTNEDNEDDKTVLAGTDVVVGSVDVVATNEALDIENVVFTLTTGTGNLDNIRNAVNNATLFLGNTKINTNSNSDIAATTASGSTAATVTFDQLTNLIVPKGTSELRLQLNTNSIGFGRIGVSLIDVNISSVVLTEIEGDESSEDADDLTLTGTLSRFDIVPAVLTTSVSSGLNTRSPIIQILANLGDNVDENSENTPNVELTTLRFDVTGTSDNTTFSLENTDGTQSITGSARVNNVVTFNMADFTSASDRTVSSGNPEQFKLTVTPPDTANSPTISVELLKNGIDYTVGSDATTYTSNANKDLPVSK